MPSWHWHNYWAQCFLFFIGLSKWFWGLAPTTNHTPHLMKYWHAPINVSRSSRVLVFHITQHEIYTLDSFFILGREFSRQREHTRSQSRLLCYSNWHYMVKYRLYFRSLSLGFYYFKKLSLLYYLRVYKSKIKCQINRKPLWRQTK